MLIRRFFCMSMVLLLSCSTAVFAEEEAEEPAEGEEGAVAAPQAIYLPLKPPLVVNYGGSGRLRYLKTELSVRVTSVTAANSVRYHMPYVRNNLVMLFASQTNETVSSQEGREKLRKDALAEIRTIVEREDKIPAEEIVDLYFNNFIVQK